MKFSFVAIVFWAAAFLGNAALLSVLIARKRARIVPWFTSWIIFNLIYSCALLAVYNYGTKSTYKKMYWTGAFLDVALQVCMTLEIAGYVFRREQGWVGGAKSRVLYAALFAALAGTGMAWTMVPAATSVLSAWGARIDLGCTVLITVLFTAIMVLSHQLGVSWRSLMLREGYGLAAWSIISFLTDTLHAYWRTVEHFTALENVRILAYLAALGYWIVIFWVPEAVPFVPDTLVKKRIGTVREALEYPRIE